MSQSDDFNKRLKKVKAKLPGGPPPVGLNRRMAYAKDDDDDLEISVGKMVLPPIAFVLGALALVAGRSIAMSQLGIEGSTQTLHIAEGVITLILMGIVVLVMGKTNYIAMLALLIGGVLAFMSEPIWVPMMASLMEQIYTPEYVSRVVLGLE